MTLDRQGIHRTSTDAKPVTHAPAGSCDERPPEAAVIVNADDWGRDVDTTDRTLDCFLHQAISSVSAMVFMEDSERAAYLALQHGTDAGLHLNFTTPFSGPQCPFRLIEHQRKLAYFLRSNRYAPLLYHPGLAASFDYVVLAQREEYQRLYGALAHRMDGHHHMHLCQNVFIQKLLPPGIIVRRNLSLMKGEAGFINRCYRGWQDRKLAQRHRITDFFFDLMPLDPSQRFERILGFARSFDVEIEAHPINIEQYRFLMDRQILGYADTVAIAPGYILRPGDLHFRAGGIR